MATFKDMMKQISNEKVNATARKHNVISAMTVYLHMCNSFCVMDDAIVDANLNTVVENLLDCEKTVSLDVLSYLADNMSVLVSMLILDYKGFRDTFADLIEVEIALDDLPHDERVSQRTAFLPENLPSTVSMKIGESYFDDDIMTAMVDLMINSFVKYKNTVLSRTVDNYIKQYVENEQIIVGILLSNIVYIIRGCNHNRAFLPTLYMMVKDAKQFFGIDY